MSSAVLEVLEDVSLLHLLQNDPPATLCGLQRRALADRSNLVDGLHSLGYYNARVSVDVEEGRPHIVKVMIDTGPIYPLASFVVQLDPEHSFSEEERRLVEALSLEELGVELTQPALPKKIRDGEANLLIALSQRGYPLALIKKREVIAEQKEKKIYVTLQVNPGKKVVFGPVDIVGLSSVHPQVVAQRIQWVRGAPYTPALISKTELELEKTGLFRSIDIQEGSEVLEGNELAMHIGLQEAMFRTFGLGASYNTQLGPGTQLHWEHRNVRGRGEKMKLKADLWAVKQHAMAEYSLPDFMVKNQELKFIANLEKERTEGFDELYYSTSMLLERRISDCLKCSYGITYKQLFSKKSDNNRPSSLLKTPLQIKWTHVDELMDPTRGTTLNLKMIPTAQVRHPHRFGYVISQLIGTAYTPLKHSENCVFAFKLYLGSISGSERFTIPPPERFYAGSESTLRGYKYMTVSPLDEENKPIGGRSLMVLSIESRLRIKKSWGWAFFYEVGNVYSQTVPQFNQQQLQSIGTGLRYHTPVGPLRADIAFPLHPRPGIDRPFQVYLSIGQAF